MVDYLERSLEGAPRGLAGGGNAAPPTLSDLRVDRGIALQSRLQSLQMSGDPRFAFLRSRFRIRVAITVVAFLSWYLLYIVLSAYARGFMATPVVGHVNVALLFGLGQFASTFLLAWAFGRFVRRWLDPLAAELRAELTDPAANGRVVR